MLVVDLLPRCQLAAFASVTPVVSAWSILDWIDLSQKAAMFGLASLLG